MAQAANHTVKLVFREVESKDEELTFLNIFVECDGREITSKLDDPTLSEVWATETLAFLESYLRETIAQGQINAAVMTAPKKKDMN